MKFDKKTKKEKIFVISIGATIICFAMLCLMGCDGSCLGYKWGCEGEDGYTFGGVSYVSEGCCSSYSCKTAVGDFEVVEEKEIDEMQEMFYGSYTRSCDNCGGSSYDYIGCHIGKGEDIGKWSVTCGSEDKENNLKCSGDGPNCEETYGEKGSLYELIYMILGI